MNIAIVTGPFFAVPPAKCGAVERRWKNMAQEFQKRGHEVTIYTRHDDALYRESKSQAPRIVQVKPSFSSRANVKFNLLLDLLYSLSVAVRSKRHDLFVTNSFWSPILLKLRFGSSTRVLVNVARQPKGQFSLYQRFGIDAYSAVSKDAARRTAREIPQSKFRVAAVNNPLEDSVFNSDVSKVGFEKRTRGVVYVGRVHPEKGIGILIEACRQLAREGLKFPVKIVGPWEVDSGGGGEAYLDVLKKSAESLDVEFVGPIYDRKLLAKTLAEFQLFCYPSIAEEGESFGIAPLEAMGVGTVPIISRLECFSDFSKHQKNALVFDHRAPDPAKELARQIQFAFENPEHLEEMSESAMQTTKEFTVEKIVSKYERLFEQVIERP